MVRTTAIGLGQSSIPNRVRKVKAELFPANVLEFHYHLAVPWLWFIVLTSQALDDLSDCFSSGGPLALHLARTGESLLLRHCKKEKG